MTENEGITMTEKRKCGKPPIYKTPSVRLTVQIEATTMEALEAWREGTGLARSVAVNRLLRIGLDYTKHINIGNNQTPAMSAEASKIYDDLVAGPTGSCGVYSLMRKRMMSPQPEPDGAKVVKADKIYHPEPKSRCEFCNFKRKDDTGYGCEFSICAFDYEGAENPYMLLQKTAEPDGAKAGQEVVK